MVQAQPKSITVDEFISQYGDSDRYELIDGELIEIVWQIINQKPGILKISTTIWVYFLQNKLKIDKKIKNRS